MKIFTERGFQRELCRRAEQADKERWEQESRRRLFDRMYRLEETVVRLAEILEKKAVITDGEAKEIRSRLCLEPCCAPVYEPDGINEG